MKGAARLVHADRHQQIRNRHTTAFLSDNPVTKRREKRKSRRQINQDAKQLARQYSSAKDYDEFDD
jgi:hypothetical protein